MAQWKCLDFLGYPKYFVSDLGDVRGPRGILTPRIVKGYLDVTLQNSVTKKRKNFRVHILVMAAFNPRTKTMPMEWIINHKDEDKTNCALTNLEWCKPKYNVVYSQVLRRQSS